MGDVMNLVENLIGFQPFIHLLSYSYTDFQTDGGKSGSMQFW